MALALLFQRKLKEVVRKRDETLDIIPSPQEHVYIRECIDCKFLVAGPTTKFTIENCDNVTVEFQSKISSGIMEVIQCSNTTLTVAKETKVPTITIDRSSCIHLHLHEPNVMSIIHTVGVLDVFVHFEPPFMTEQKVDHPPQEDGEFMTRCSVGKLMTEKCIREGGGYLTTVREKEIADKKVAEFEKKMEEMVAGTIGKKPKPVATNDKKDTPKTTPTQASPKSKPVDVGKDGSLADALQKGKDKLKHAETVEKHLPVVGVGSCGRGQGNQYNISDDAEKKEYFDGEEALDKKVKKIADWVRGSKHTILFTGAGISTSAGIPDFRSGMNTVLATGPGVWEVRAQGTSRPNTKITPILQASPTPTHMAIVKLHESGLCKFTVSQNVDGLHRRSGLPPNQLSEMHGNTNMETCKKCGRQYLRDFQTREAEHVFDHTTSRLCDDPACKGQLKDSIINFGENLPQGELTKAFNHAQKADVCIVLGSSLRVRPACQVPEVVAGNKGKVVICNLQKIPQFPESNNVLPVYSMCDTFMKKLMHELQLEIPKFLLHRRAKVTSKTKGDNLEVTVNGIDVDEDIPYSFIMAASCGGKRIAKAPFTFSVPAGEAGSQPLQIKLEFLGHYGEGPLTLEYEPAHKTCLYWLSYDMSEGAWHQMKKQNQ
ncbi:PREDICTED: uncharacterized protein LOC100633014 [Amphimedon queenslandica]|uniref:Regulatory protein SIR2 homolog 7 n=1 Tax=Amphimedon queenslandica TaxID=400682 RepID=A0A1X7U3E3_AMPQE|nr:PREDICTED: uncharacterized protein LOC100633014 [Amphimedon queenslandica]|eukprot:XP_011406188.1 PREDICTED: uncharacterized protein LOC100633014 [Amphimedon queenslandica]